MRRTILTILLLMLLVSLSTGEDEFNSEIYLSYDIYYQNKLEQAFNLEIEERFDAALTVYIEILNKLENTLSEGNEKIEMFYQANLYTDIYEKRNLLGRYLPVKEFVLNQIAELPIDIRKRYERLISSKSEILFNEAMEKYDKTAIFQIAENYFLAEKGADYLFHAGRLAFESGEFALGAYYFEKIYDYWSKEFSRNTLCIFYLATCYAGSGNTYKFEKFCNSAMTEYKGLSITINNKVYNDVTVLLSYDKLKEIVLNDLKNKDIILKWGSDADQNKIQFDFNTFEGNSLVFSTRGSSEYSYYRRNGRTIVIRRGRVSYGNSQDTKNLIPAFSNNRIVIGNNEGIQQIKFIKKEPQKKSIVVKFPESMYMPKNSFSYEGVEFDRIIVSGRYAYGIFNKEVENNQNYGYYRYYSSSSTTKVLACIDLEDENKVIWWVPGHAEDLDIEKFNELPINFLTEVGIDNSFVLHDNKIFAAGIHPGDQEKRFYAMCFDATPDSKNGGRLLWHSKLATVKAAGWDSYQLSRTISTFSLKYYSGFLYVLSNKGIIACLDTATGNVKYINRYMRPKTVTDPDEVSRWYRQQADVKGLHWGYNPIVVHKSFVYFTPMDSRKLYVMNAQTGEFVREFPFGSESVDDYMYLLGVSDDILHIQGRQKCYGLNLKLDYDPKSESAQNYELFSYKTVPFDIFGVQEKVIGRGVLGDKYFYVPTRRGVIKFEAKTGKRMNEIMNWQVSDGVNIRGDLYLYKTAEKKYLVLANFAQIVLMPVE